MVTVLVSAEANEQIAAPPTSILQRVEALVNRLKSWPAVSGAKPLTRHLVGKYRMRTGDYRLQFSVETVRQVEKTAKLVKGKPKVKEIVRLHYTITVEKVGHRDKFYEG